MGRSCSPFPSISNGTNNYCRRRLGSFHGDCPRMERNRITTADLSTVSEECAKADLEIHSSTGNYSCNYMYVSQQCRFQIPSNLTEFSGFLGYIRLIQGERRRIWHIMISLD